MVALAHGLNFHNALLHVVRECQLEKEHVQTPFLKVLDWIVKDLAQQPKLSHAN